MLDTDIPEMGRYCLTFMSVINMPAPLRLLLFYYRFHLNILPFIPDPKHLDCSVATELFSTL